MIDNIMRGMCVLMCTLGLYGCGEYQQLLKSKDPDLKYQKALVYFNDEQYIKAQTLLDEVTSYYKGTDRSQDVLAYLSRCYMGQKDYLSAAEYYQAYIRNYPKGRYIVEARFQVGHCYYLDAPDARLDQTETYEAINALSEFISLYPESDRVADCRKYLFEMEDKLAYKELLSSKLYYNLGLYGGNNYRACVTTAENALKDFPETKYRDDLVFIILKAKSKEASLSVEDKKRERYSEVIDEYYRYANAFPNGKHIKEANRILREAKNIVK